MTERLSSAEKNVRQSETAKKDGRSTAKKDGKGTMQSTKKRYAQKEKLDIGRMRKLEEQKTHTTGEKEHF